MWYVNCKKFVVVPLAHFRFILTMWYVNSANIIACPFCISRFILTMWYVNTNKFEATNVEDALVLY